MPTPEESDHDFLWRVHPHVPGKGRIAIFNRSHYEDVLVPRVHGTIDKAVWTERSRWDAYVQAFEDALSATSTADAPWYVVPSDHKWFRSKNSS